MVSRCNEYKERFLKEYNQQKRVEVFFSNMRRCLGPSTESRIVPMRRKDVGMRCLIMNMLVVAGEEVDEELRVAG